MKSLWRKWTLLPLKHQLISAFISTTIFTVIISGNSITGKRYIAYSASALIFSFLIPKDYFI